MRLRSRVILIVCGLIIFIIIGPSVILLARGFRYDFSQNRIVKTGTLVVKTDPKGARVFLNGKELKTSPLTQRFINPDEYFLEIEKDNYFPWRKRITIHPQQVTAINPQDTDKIALFLNSPVISLVATSTADFFAGKDEIFYINDSSVYRMSQGGENPALFATPTQKLESPHILTGNNDRVLVEEAGQIYYFSGAKQILLPDDFDQVVLGPGDTLYAKTRAGELVQFDLLTLKRESVANLVQAFAMFANDIYYISAETQPTLYQIAAGQAPRLLAGHLPQCPQDCKIIFTEDKQIFLLLDQTLYKLNHELEKINSPVMYADQTPDGLLYGNNNEVWLYRTFNRPPNQLLTRVSQKLGYSIYNKQTGYLFIAGGREIKAIEFDKSGQPNVYTLARTKNTDPKFSVNEDGTHLTYLDDGSFITLQIR